MQADLKHTSYSLLRRISYAVMFVFVSYANCAVGQTNFISPLLASSVESSEKGSWRELDTHAHVIVYRDDASLTESSYKVINVFVNKQYHTSLLAKDQSIEMSLCPGSKVFEVTSAKINHSHYISSQNVNINSPVFHEGQLYYLKVVSNGEGKISSEWVSESRAKQELKDLKLQVRTISRVVSEDFCPESKFFIDDKNFFLSQNGHMTELSSDGVNTLNKLKSIIEKRFASINNIIVSDFSDKDKHAFVEHPFSQMRANSVSSWLIKSNILSASYSSKGREISTCGKYNNDVNQSSGCELYKSGVLIEVYGARNHLVLSK